jgi:hypothetical protein
VSRVAAGGDCAVATVEMRVLANAAQSSDDVPRPRNTIWIPPVEGDGRHRDWPP